MAKRYYDLALETSADAYFPATLSLISLYARALYHVLFTSPDDELKALALFGNSVVPVAKDGTNPFPAAPPLGQPWSFGRAWREIQRRWGIDPGPEVELPAGQPPVMDQRGAHGRREDVAEAQRALEANENPLEWGRGRRENARLDDEEDEFYVDGDGDLTGTLAIVALSVLLGCVLALVIEYRRL
jgi:SEL1 protein